VLQEMAMKEHISFFDRYLDECFWELHFV
jgi:hypothetical protein